MLIPIRNKPNANINYFIWLSIFYPILFIVITLYPRTGWPHYPFLVNFSPPSPHKYWSTSLILSLFYFPFHTFNQLDISHFNIFAVQIVFLLARLLKILHFIKNLLFLGLLGRLRLGLCLSSKLVLSICWIFIRATWRMFVECFITHIIHYGLVDYFMRMFESFLDSSADGFAKFDRKGGKIVFSWNCLGFGRCYHLLIMSLLINVFHVYYPEKVDPLFIILILF